MPAQIDASKKISVPSVPSGSTTSIASVPGGQIVFEFDPTTALFARQENSLVITEENGGVIILEDFFVVGEETLPEFVLPDNTVINGADLLASLNPDLDLTTAAGPTAAAPGSGGTNYADDAGDLIGGLDKLGTLGTDYWGQGFAVAVEDEDNTTLSNITITAFPPDELEGQYTVEAGNVNLTVNEANLPNGSDSYGNNPNYRLAFQINSDNGVASVTIEGQTYTFDANGQMSLVGNISDDDAESDPGYITEGQLVDLGNGAYRLELNYEFNSAYQHKNSIQGTDTADNADVFTISVTTTNGTTSAPVELRVDVIDDVPTGELNAAGSADDIANIGSGATTTGVFNLTAKGADQEAGDTFKVGNLAITADGTSIAGTYGTLTVNMDGSYSLQGQC